MPPPMTATLRGLGDVVEEDMVSRCEGRLRSDKVENCFLAW